MLETKRELCWTPGGEYSEITWDPDTGCAEIRDCDAEDGLIARHEWGLLPEPIGADGMAGEHRTFDVRGVKISTRTIIAPAA